MIKINLITKTESGQLAKLRASHQFYLDNYDHEYMRRIRLAKINKALDLARAVIDVAQSVMNATANMNNFIAAHTKMQGGVRVEPIKAVQDRVEEIKRQSELE